MDKIQEREDKYYKLNTKKNTTTMIGSARFETKNQMNDSFM